MDNLIFKKIWQDEDLLELNIIGMCDYVKAHQDCYISKKDLEELANKIKKINDTCEKIYLEFGKKDGDYTPAFSLLIMPKNKNGHIKIEVDMEINDIETRTHRCMFFVNTELGMLEKFSEKMKRIKDFEIGKMICLNEINN
ncbi:MAG: hypothetical protein IJJ82_00595 [Clostridia bacterium]|nr:hypothetical protein [Clostridia bacterium]